MIMCTVTNFALYLIFVVATNGEYDQCSEEYQLLELVVAKYEAAKYPTPEREAERAQVVRAINCVFNGTQCDD